MDLQHSGSGADGSHSGQHLRGHVRDWGHGPGGAAESEEQRAGGKEEPDAAGLRLQRQHRGHGGHHGSGNRLGIGIGSTGSLSLDFDLLTIINKQKEVWRLFANGGSLSELEMPVMLLYLDFLTSTESNIMCHNRNAAQSGCAEHPQ